MTEPQNVPQNEPMPPITTTMKAWTMISTSRSEQREGGIDQDAEGQHLAIDDRTPERAPERAHAADHDDDEGLDDDQHVQIGTARRRDRSGCRRTALGHR